MRLAFCCARACMAEKFADPKKTCAVCNRETGERVPQVVNAQAGQIGFGAYLLKKRAPVRPHRPHRMPPGRRTSRKLKKILDLLPFRIDFDLLPTPPQDFERGRRELNSARPVFPPAFVQFWRSGRSLAKYRLQSIVAQELPFCALP